MAFETLLALAAEGDRQTLAELAAKNPWLREHVELGERVKPLRSRLEALKLNDFEPAIKEIEDWRKWKAEDWLVHEQNSDNLRTAVATAQARVAELEERDGTDMTPEEIRQIVTETLTAAMTSQGVVDKKMLETTINDLVEKTVNPRIQQYTDGLTSRFEDVFDKVEGVINSHRAEFNEYVSPKEVFEHMKKTGQMDPEKAYQDLVAPKLQAKHAKDVESKIEAAKAEGKLEGRREAAASSGRSNPTDGRGPVRMGALQRRLHEKAEQNKDKPGSDRLGSGQIAAKVSAEHREKELQGSAA